MTTKPKRGKLTPRSRGTASRSACPARGPRRVGMPPSERAGQRQTSPPARCRPLPPILPVAPTPTERCEVVPPPAHRNKPTPPKKKAPTATNRQGLRPTRKQMHDTDYAESLQDHASAPLLCPDVLSADNYTFCHWATTVTGLDPNTETWTIIAVTCKRWGCPYCAIRKYGDSPGCAKTPPPTASSR